MNNALLRDIRGRRASSRAPPSRAPPTATPCIECAGVLLLGFEQPARGTDDPVVSRRLRANSAIVNAVSPRASGRRSPSSHECDGLAACVGIAGTIPHTTRCTQPCANNRATSTQRVIVKHLPDRHPVLTLVAWHSRRLHQCRFRGARSPRTNGPDPHAGRTAMSRGSPTARAHRPCRRSWRDQCHGRSGDSRPGRRRPSGRAAGCHRTRRARLTMPS